MTTLDPEFTLQDTFPPVSYDQWRALAEASLKGAPFDKKLVTQTYEGIDLQPVYTLEDRSGSSDGENWPGFAPFVRGSTPSGDVLSGWDLRQEHCSPQPADINKDILSDLEGGVTSLHLVLDRASRSGLDPDDERAKELVGLEGMMAYHVDDLDQVLADVHLSMIQVALEAGAAFLPAAAMLASLWRRRGISPKEARGAFNADPLATPARDGELPQSLESALAQMADLASWTSTNYPNVTAVGVDTSPYHHAGATAAQDLAFAMATAVQYLQSMTDAGLNISAASEQILFRLSLGTHHFLAIAKLRAARRLWSRIVDTCDGSPASAAMKVHTRMSERVLTRHDPYVNLLRNTVSVFSAGLGGADSITSVPFDIATGSPDEFSRRIARNTGLILQEEAHLHRVIDPAGGSWFLENLTDQVADKAWDIFQDIQGQGGMIEVLRSGWVAEQIESAFAPRAKDIATRKEGITGVSEFPDLQQPEIKHERPNQQELRASASQRIQELRKDSGDWSPFQTKQEITRSAIEAAAQGASLGQLAKSLGFNGEPTLINPLPLNRFSKPYEELRDACEAWQAEQGRRPCVFLANLGPIAHHTARATYSRSFFEAGGFEVISNEGFDDAESATSAFQESGAGIAVLCSSDKLYPKFVPEVASQLKAAGARMIVLAGKPGPNEDSWREAGVDRFIYISCDVLGTLRDMLAQEGVLAQ